MGIGMGMGMKKKQRLKTRLAQAKPESRRKSFEKREISQAWNSNQSYNK